MCNEAARRTALGLMREDFSQLKIPLRFPEGLPNLGEAPSIRITDTTVIVRAVPGAPPGADPFVEMVQRRWSWPSPSARSSAANARPGGFSSAAASSGRPVYNFRSEGRRFGNSGPGEPGFGRCLIPLDGFYEFTDNDAATILAQPPADGARASTLPLPLEAGGRAAPSPRKGAGKKAKWLFTLSPGAGAAWNPDGRAAPGLFAVAGLWRAVDLGRTGGSAARGATGEAWTMLTCAPGPDVAPYHSRQIVLMPRDRWADWLGIGGGAGAAEALIAPTPGGTLVVTRIG